MDDVAVALPEVTQDDIDAVTRVLRSGWVTSGEECLALERDLAGYLGAGTVVAMASCSAAIETCIAFLDLPDGARVGVPTWTFPATALAVVHQGGQPVLLDIEPDTLNVSTASLAAAIDEGLDAVVAVHFGGVPCRPGVHAVCSERGVPLVEDAAHALGASDHRGRVAGQGAVGACFSFYATKNLTAGEGGALVTDDPELAAFARSFRLHGLSSDAWSLHRAGTDGAAADLVAPGIKANLPDVLAALARSQLTRFDAAQQRRRAAVECYRSFLTEIEGVTCVPPLPDQGSADHLMVVLLPEGAERDVVRDRLAALGVATSVHFRPLHTYEWFAAHAAVGPLGVATADAVAARALSLPLHLGLQPGDIERVCSALAEAVATARHPIRSARR